jgi:hypothetical protein
MSRESVWKKARLGRITASELSEIFSASGKATDGNVDYVRRKRFERRHGFAYPVSARNFDIGHEQEPYAVEWFRANHPEVPVVYAQECEEIPVWVADFANFSASPDAFSPDGRMALEVKTVVGNTSAEFYGDDLTSLEDKRASVLKDHGYQIAGQFLSNPAVEEIWLLKYIYQRDEVEEDVDSPLAPWRGLVFKFTRGDFDLDAIRERIVAFDRFIDSGEESKALKSLFPGKGK